MERLSSAGSPTTDPELDGALGKNAAARLSVDGFTTNSTPIHSATTRALCGLCPGSFAKHAMMSAAASGGMSFRIPNAASRSSIGSGASFNTWWLMSPLQKGNWLVNNS
ncbi:MAG: hypothetical protein ABSF38_19120 [Verrucomicrobiota bacterium]